MRRTILVHCFVLIVGFGGSTLAAAQSGGKATATYDRAAEITLTGTVVQVLGAEGAGGVYGVHLVVKTASGIVNVHVGPALFIAADNFWFQCDEPIAVIGATVSSGGQRAVWARAITKGSKTLVLRTADGTPLWKDASAESDGCGVSHPPM